MFFESEGTQVFVTILGPLNVKKVGRGQPYFSLCVSQKVGPPRPIIVHVQLQSNETTVGPVYEAK